MEQINTVGRRKRAIARVFLSKGEGNMVVNGKDYKDYFPQAHISNKLMEPFQVAEVEMAYDLKINISGGGFKGQAEAARLGISRALIQLNAEYRGPLKASKFLMRDARVVERKKYGKPKARKSFQFSKR